MLMLIVKYAVTSLVIVAVSEIAKRADKAGAIVASLPLTTILVMIWLHLENQPREKISNHAYYTFWYVLPTLPMFLLFPVLLNRGMSFVAALAACCGVTVVCFALTAMILKPFGIDLMP